VEAVLDNVVPNDVTIMVAGVYSADNVGQILNLKAISRHIQRLYFAVIYAII